MALLYLTWTAYIAGLVYLPLKGGYALALAWSVALPAGLWAYMRVFPEISQLLGYGRVDDVAASPVAQHPVRVTMYSSFGCPFCPIVERRLKLLQEQMGFELEHVDVTVRLGLLQAKGIRAVPVVEVGDQRLVGHATSQELAELIRSAG